ncbi:MAG: FAD-binding domain [Mycobacterium sp.]|jgi:2-polyprenyl-6-methoxyphenol hydroxylase-like FAD-dependent oxidoreductase|nr:FAD-binding domain [Mycobacterium sp.]
MKVAISGAGVAGTALAYWLHRTGHTPTLIEQAPAFRTGGYMIDFWGVGYRVAKKMGIEDQLLDAGYEIQQLRSVDSDGKVKAELPVEAIRNLIGHDFTSLPRGDLAATVYRTVADKVETVFGDTITAVDDHGDGVRLTFGNAEPREFDLLVGADGLHSNVRRLAFGTGPEVERYLGCKVAACVVDGYRPRDELVYLTYNTLGRQAGRVALREDRTLFLFIFRAERTDAGAQPKDELRTQFGDAGWECPQMLDALDDADDLYFDVVSQIKMDHWSRGRVGLIGDAAGCISLLGGEGTGLAMTEAYVLAGELDRARGDHREAFEAYEALMHPFVASKQAGAARFVGFFATRTRFGLWLRNIVMRAMNVGPVLRLVAGDIRDDLELPQYAI